MKRRIAAVLLVLCLSLLWWWFWLLPTSKRVRGTSPGGTTIRVNSAPSGG